MLRIALVILLLSSFPAKGQELITRSVDELEDIQIQAITQSESGELFMIDKHKLYGFDGYRLSVKVDFEDRKADLTCILTTGTRILIGDSEGTLFILDGDQLDSMRISQDKGLETLVEKDRNDLFILLKDHEILELSRSDDRGYTVKEGPSALLANDIMANGSIYFATDQGMFKGSRNDSDLVFLEGIGNSIITQVIEGEDGELWLSDFYGTIYFFKPSDSVLRSTTLGERLKITDLRFLNGYLYVSSNKGIFQVHQDFEGQLMSQHVIKEATRSLMIDDEANLWMVKDERVDFAQLHFFKYPYTIEDELHSQCFFNGQHILGTENRLIHWRPEKNDIEVLVDHINVTCMDQSHSILAVGTYDKGVHIYSAQLAQSAYLTNLDGLADNTILALEVRDDEHIIVSTLAGVNEVSKKNGTWTVDRDFEGLESFYMLTILSDSRGRIWFGTDNKGVILYQEEASEHMARTDQGLETGSISSICETADGKIWMISEHLGVIAYADGSLQQVASPHSSWGRYTSIIPLKENRLMLIGEKEVAIYNINKNELLEFSDDIKLERATSFFNNHAIGPDGIYFEHGGILYQYLDDGGRSRSESITHLVDVQVDLASVDTTLHDFSEQDNSFQFIYSGLLYRDPKKVQYSYRLLGFDDQWRYTKDRQIAYSHLPPGEFEFQVRSSHDLSHSQAEIISYGFEIHRRFYNHWWFKALLISLALLLIYWSSRRRRKAREMVDKLTLLSTKTKLLNLKSQLNPHFLFNSFNTVIGLIEEDKDRSIVFVEKLTDFFRKILEIGESELIPIETELDLLRDYVHLMTERFGQGLSVEIPKSMSPTLVPPMSLQLLVENAVKHNVVKEADPMRVRIEESEDFIVVTNPYRPRTSIKDTMGIGLENLKERYHILAKKEIVIEITEDVFKVSLPKIHRPDRSNSTDRRSDE